MKEDFIFTVQQLIDALKDLPPHAAVHAWDNGDRLLIKSVDKVDETTVDLNIDSIDLTEEFSQLRKQLDDMRRIVESYRKLSEEDRDA